MKAIIDSYTGVTTITIIAGGSKRSAIDSNIRARDGTTEYEECSNRGVCNYDTGICDCFDGFVSSDGLGNLGSRGDCGHFYWNMATYPTSQFCPYYTNSATNLTELCSGHGTCSSGACICDTGYGISIFFISAFQFFISHCCTGGPGCSEMLCTSSKAWFGSIGQSHSGLIECAGVGECNRKTGKCR